MIKIYGIDDIIEINSDSIIYKNEDSFNEKILLKNCARMKYIKHELIYIKKNKFMRWLAEQGKKSKGRLIVGGRNLLEVNPYYIFETRKEDSIVFCINPKDEWDTLGTSVSKENFSKAKKIEEKLNSYGWLTIDYA